MGSNEKKTKKTRGTVSQCCRAGPFLTGSGSEYFFIFFGSDSCSGSSSYKKEEVNYKKKNLNTISTF